MEKRNTLNKKLTELIVDLPEDDIIIPIEFNLHPTASHDKVDGLIGVLKDRVVVFSDNILLDTIPLDTISEFNCITGIGCIFLECTMTDGTCRVLCRADMSYSRLFAAVSKRINRYCRDEGKVPFDYSYEEEIDIYCPKCGRLYQAGSKICSNCVDKKSYLKRLWAIAYPHRFYIYVSIVMYFLISAVALITPYFNRIMVDDFIKAETMPKWQQFVLIIFIIFLLNIVINIMSVVRGLTLIQASSKVVVKLRELIFNKIQMLSLSRISKRTSGELMNRVTDDTSMINNFLVHEIGAIIEQIIVFVVVGTFLFIYDWKLALLILLPIPFVVVFNRAFFNFMRMHWHKQWKTHEKASSILHDIFSGIRVVKAFGMEHREYERFDEAIKEQRDVQFFNEKFYAVVSPIINFVMGIGEFFLLYYAGNKILNLEMSLGYMQQITAYIGMIYGPMRWVSNLPRLLVRLTTSVVKIFDIIDEKIDVADKTNAVDLEIEGYIDIDNISFGYDEAVDVLRNVSLKINPGEMIGIVGKSGVGKSTLINLIMRMYDVDEGVIKIDGVDIKDISQESLRSQIGVVLQETFLFSGTIYDNIAYAKANATHDEVITASKIAGAHQFIMRLPDAYNTKVGEKGYTLSGGERQRVSIARALLHNPRILILDEATASLDTETEKQIQDSLQKLIKDRTTLAIAHRLSTLRNATRLVVLDKGKVVEVGTHEELMKQHGIYFGLVMAQRQMSKIVSTKNAQ